MNEAFEFIHPHKFCVCLEAMKCILVFDHLNDVLYTKYNKKFSKHVKKLSREQGLVSDGRVCGDELRQAVKVTKKLGPFF